MHHLAKTAGGDLTYKYGIITQNDIFFKKYIYFFLSCVLFDSVKHEYIRCTNTNLTASTSQTDSRQSDIYSYKSVISCYSKQQILFFYSQISNVLDVSLFMSLKIT